MFRMRPALQDQIAKGSGGRTDRSGGAANALNSPIGVAPVARRHVLGKGGVPVVAAAAPMRRDPLTLEKDLDGLRGQPHLDLAARKAVRDAVKMSVDLDMVIDADAAQAPFGKAIGLGGQLLEMGPIELFEQGAPGDPEPSERALVVELPQQLANRCIELGQTVKVPMAQSAR